MTAPLIIEARRLFVPSICLEAEPMHTPEIPRFHVDQSVTSRRIRLPAEVYDHDAMCAWLRRKYPAQTHHAIAADTGIPSRTVEGWFSRGYQPRSDHMLRMIYVYGPAFLAAAYKVDVAWLMEAERLERRHEIETAIARLEKERDGLK